MKTQTRTFLSIVDRISHQLAPVDAVVAWMADRFLPQATAEASGCVPPSGLEVCAEECYSDTNCQAFTGNCATRAYWGVPGSPCYRNLGYGTCCSTDCWFAC